MTNTNEIQIERILNADRQKVWNALTQPELIGKWFCERVLGKFETNEILTLDFGKWGVCYAIVHKVKPMDEVSLRWHPGEDCEIDKYPENEMTTITFWLEDHESGTKLIMIESGFDNIPMSRRAKCVELNAGGWDYEIKQLVDYVEDGAEQEDSSDELLRTRELPISVNDAFMFFADETQLAYWFAEKVEDDRSTGTRTLNVNGETGTWQFKNVEMPCKMEFLSSPWFGSGRNSTDDLLIKTTVTIEEHEGGSKIQVLEQGYHEVPEPERTELRIAKSHFWNKKLVRLLEKLGGEVFQ